MLTSFHEMFSHVSPEICEQFHLLVQLLRVLAHRHVLFLALPVNVMDIPAKTNSNITTNSLNIQE